jgi:hypothetical protein
MAAIQFPPILPGEPQPVNGDTYLYLPTNQEYVCTRASMAQTPRWTPQGVLNPTTFAYQGIANLETAAPAAETGWIYSSETAVDAADINATWIGLANQVNISQFQLVIYANPTWAPINANVTNPWIRTTNGNIQPVIPTDDLDMLDGNYEINTLDALP